MAERAVGGDGLVRTRDRRHPRRDPLPRGARRSRPRARRGRHRPRARGALLPRAAPALPGRTGAGGPAGGPCAGSRPAAAPGAGGARRPHRDSGSERDLVPVVGDRHRAPVASRRRCACTGTRRPAAAAGAPARAGRRRPAPRGRRRPRGACGARPLGAMPCALSPPAFTASSRDAPSSASCTQASAPLRRRDERLRVAARSRHQGAPRRRPSKRQARAVSGPPALLRRAQRELADARLEAVVRPRRPRAGARAGRRSPPRPPAPRPRARRAGPRRAPVCPADRSPARAAPGEGQPQSQSSRPTVFSGSRLVRSTVRGCATGMRAGRRAWAAPRPASTSTSVSPRPTPMQGPRRRWFS